MFYAIQKTTYPNRLQETMLLGFRTRNDRSLFMSLRDPASERQFTPITRRELSRGEVRTFKTFGQDGVFNGVVVYSVRLYR